MCRTLGTLPNMEEVCISLIGCIYIDSKPDYINVFRKLIYSGYFAVTISTRNREPDALNEDFKVQKMKISPNTTLGACVPLDSSRSESVIQDHSGHGASMGSW